MKKLIAIALLAGGLFTGIPTAKADHWERRFSHYDRCGRPVYVEVYVRTPRYRCEPPPPRCERPRHEYSGYGRGYYQSPPRGYISFGFWR